VTVSEWLYGRQAVREALRAGRPIQRLLLALSAPAAAKPVARGGKASRPSPRAPSGPVPLPAPLAELASLAQARRIGVERVPQARLDDLTNRANHQGVAAQAAPYRYLPWGDLVERVQAAGPEALVLLLDSLQDPQNFGTLLRAADAAGVTGVVLTEHRAVGVTPAVVNASAGAVEHLAVAQVANLSRAVEQLQNAGLWIWALDTDPPTTLYSDADLTGPLGLVVGAEGKGVSRLVRARCDGALALPMRGQVASLNAATAGSIMLYEVLRQRGQAAKNRPGDSLTTP
jgi:23S rRNA (guanosine2251-2'-O)-methyltransferase